MSSRNVSELIKQLFEISQQLKAEIPGRNSLSSGQKLGNLGEALFAETSGLNLCKAMTKRVDVHTDIGRMVQIKTITSRADDERSASSDAWSSVSQETEGRTEQGNLPSPL